MTNDKLKIAVADDERDMRDFFQKILTHLGYQVIIEAENGEDLVTQCLAVTPDLIITDIEMPIMDGLTAVNRICKERPIPAIVVTAHHDDQHVQRALHEQILAYLVKPIKMADLQPVISLAVQRYKEFEALHKQTVDLRQALEDRKLIEKAKGILMSRTQMVEGDAFRRLQQLSNEKNVKMVEIARMIVTAEEAFKLT
ncbi:MAG: response regulator [Planctomycetota bacterium]|nr:response regulator [Planctomycetota bacterium]MDA1212212.1 response regulator [Planctomycetota bacterium]